MKIAAAIFDLDGTIIDSEEAWGKAYSSVLKSLGADVDENNSHIFGESVEFNLKDQISKHNIKTGKTIDELVTLAFVEFQKFIPLVTMEDGAAEFMEGLGEAGTPLALATSANWETTDKILTHFGLTGLFECITTVEEIDNPKPAPDIYLLSAEKLGVDPEDCLVFEDSPAGVAAGKDAGMKVIAINSNDDDREKLTEANLIVEDFSEITPKVIDQL